jgi:thioredoxin reductase (NADPH)
MWGARFVLLATGLVDCSPPIPSDAIRFCPICDGYEAIDRQMGALGDINAGGKKAHFLRTYTRNVWLFLTDEAAVDADARRKLEGEGVRAMGRPRRTQLVTEGTIVVVTENGQRHELAALYPALGCVVRSELATALGAGCNENGNLIVDDHQRTTIERL